MASNVKMIFYKIQDVLLQRKHNFKSKIFIKKIIATLAAYNSAIFKAIAIKFYVVNIIFFPYLHAKVQRNNLHFNAVTMC